MPERLSERVIARARKIEYLHQCFRQATAFRSDLLSGLLRVSSTIPGCFDYVCLAIAQASSRGLPDTVGRYNTRTNPSRLHCGTSGPRLPPIRSPLSRPQLDSRSTGAPSQPGGSRASVFPRSRMPPVFLRPEIRRSTCGFLSMNRITSLDARRQRSMT